MKVYHSRPRSGWTQVPNTLARDPRLSWRARGLLVHLLSLPSGTAVTVDQLVTEAKADNSGVEGRDAMRSAFSEIVEAGYGFRHPRRRGSNGQYEQPFEVADTPRWSTASQDGISGQDQDGFSVKAPTSANEPEPQVNARTDSQARTRTDFQASSLYKTEEKTEEPPPNPEPTPDEAPTNGGGGEDLHPKTNQVLAALPFNRDPDPLQKARLAKAVSSTLTERNLDPARLIKHLWADPKGVGDSYAIYMYRLNPEILNSLDKPTAAAVDLDIEHCGDCELPFRTLEDDQGAVYACPVCSKRYLADVMEAPVVVAESGRYQPKYDVLDQDVDWGVKLLDKHGGDAEATYKAWNAQMTSVEPGDGKWNAYQRSLIILADRLYHLTGVRRDIHEALYGAAKKRTSAA